jgi:hypothetical protein
MANDSQNTETSQATPGLQQPFTLYAAQGRVYASNVDEKLIDLGSLAQADDGWQYRLDGNGQAAGGLPDAQSALQHLATHLRFLYLDGQFTALVDERGSAALDLGDGARLDILLDELPPGERIQDASV